MIKDKIIKYKLNNSKTIKNVGDYLSREMTYGFPTEKKEEKMGIVYFLCKKNSNEIFARINEKEKILELKSNISLKIKKNIEKILEIN